VAVEQGRLNPTDTTKDMENFYGDAVVSVVTDVDRVLHNGTQFVRLVMRRAQPELAGQAASASPDAFTEASHLIDGFFIANPSSAVDIIRVGFALNQLVSTTEIKVYSTVPLDTTAGNWAVATSLDGTDSQFNLSNFQATGISVSETPVVLDSQSQFRYDISFTPPAIGGLRYWRIKRTAGADLSNVTEVRIVEPLEPTISYFDTDGSFATSTTFEESNILDATYDNINDVFYTIRFNTDNVGTTNLNLSDDFSEAEAGSAQSTTGFNPARWSESSQNPQFLRLSEELTYNVAAGDGQIETTYALTGDLGVSLFVDAQNVTSEQSWLVVRALDTNNNTIMSEGVGYDSSPTATGVVFTSYISNLVNSTNDSEIRELRPQYHNTVPGTDSFTIAFDGANWTVTGTLTGELQNATTGVLYDESTDVGTPVEFIISAAVAPTLGEQFAFDLVTVTGHRLTATGIVGFQREGSNYTTSGTIGSPVTAPTGDVTIEIYGNTATSVDFAADNFAVSGTGTFPSLAVFTVEKTDSDGNVISPPLIESFDVIGDPSKTYNDFLDGRVQITTAQSGTGGGSIYIKVNNQLFKYANNVAFGIEDGTSADNTSTGQIPADGTNSFNWTHESGVNGLPFLTYVDYDELLDIVRLKTVNKDTLLDTSSSKEIRLNITNYEANQFKLFYDQNDFDTLQYVDASTNLQSFNVDDRISAFMAVNALDNTLPAGTALQTLVNADVINAWGETLDGKVVTFAVTAGDGAVSPSSNTTVSGGRASTQFTVGSTVGVSTVTATVTEA